MFSVHFGTIESSAPDWFDWLTLGLTLIVSAGSIYFAYWLAERSFKLTQFEKEQEDVELSKEHYNLFLKILEYYSNCVRSQITLIDEYLSDKNHNLTFKEVIDLPNDLLSNLDILKIEKHLIKNNLNTENFHKLLIKLHYTNDIISKAKEEFFRYYEAKKNYEIKFKENQISLIRYNNFELLILLQDNDFSLKYKSAVIAYNELIYNADSDKEIFPQDGKNPVNKQMLFEKVFKPSIEIIKNLRAEHVVFLEIASKLNSIVNIMNDTENLEDNHFTIFRSYKKILEGVEKEINKFNLK